MSKFVGALISIMMVFGLAACGNQNSSPDNNAMEPSATTTEGSIRTPEQQETPTGIETNPAISTSEMDPQTESDTTKVLVVYFSHTGNTRTIAELIQNDVASVLFEIETVNPYPDDYDTLVDLAKQEQNENVRPELATHVDDMDSYDVIFIGYPIWWGTMPMAVFTFLEEYDFSGKTIIPFCTHEGSGLGRSESDLAELLPNSTLLEGLAIRGSGVNSAQESVTSWLRKLGFE